MGGTTFDHYASGVDVKDAFSRAREEAGYESGHGGYSGTIVEKGDFVVITRTPLLEREAHALASKMLDNNDPLVSDKWGPAGAIPVVKSTRQAIAKGFEYVHDSSFREPGKIQPELLAAVEPLVKLKKGETIQSIHVSTYEQPSTRPSYGYGGSFSRSTKSARRKCQATVVINKPPATRKAPIVIEIPAGLDYDQTNKEIQKQVATMRLKAGESVIDWSATRSTPGKATVTATAPKGATETRYVVVGKDRFGNSAPIPRMGHDTWEKGFESQAKAREWLTGVANKEENWVGNGPLAHLGDDVTMEIESVTRRATGEPLVSVRRVVDKRLVDVEVEVKLASASTPASPDGWLFFGWSSC